MRWAALALALLPLFASPGAAQVGTPGAADPLSRRITIRVRDVALRDALDRVAVLAGIRVSYSAETVVLDRRVSLVRDDVTVEDAFSALLAGQRLRAVAVAADHVVLVPTSPLDTTPRPVAMLERVVVTGSVAGTAERHLTLALDVVDGRVVERRNASSLAAVLDASAPGVWLWDQGPSRMVAQYGSIRGASSFNLSYPKVYIDGVEVANPLLLTHISPELTDRLEIIRGPQGAAMYGADAISGVVNIVSRHSGTPPDGKHAQMRSEMGWSRSAFGSTPTPVQQHGITLRAGTNERSGAIAASGSTTGDYIPNAYSRELSAAGNARVIGRASTLTINARANARRAGVPDNPLLGTLTARTAADDDPQALDLYSIGSRFQRAANEQLTFSLTGGVNGYRLRNVPIESTPVPSSADTALRAASGAADRGTIRGDLVRQFGDRERVGSTLTLAVEKSVLRDRTGTELPGPGSGPGSGPGAMMGVSPVVRGWSNNTGFLAQTDVAVGNAAFITAGGRIERISPTRSATITEFLPMFGAALVHDFPRMAAKVRGAYGRGVRAPRTWAYGLRHDPRLLATNVVLEPEQQRGTEFGIDVFMRNGAGLHVTRFDQVASDLIQTVTFADSTIGPGPGTGQWRHHLRYQLQNLGEISNTGWEAAASLTVGSLTLGGVGSLVDSRVRRLARGYTGDLRPGDRMLGVPGRTISSTASWTGRRWSTSWTVSRASDWVNYDRLRIAQQFADSLSQQTIAGANLRSFWIEYPGATRLRASLAFDLQRSFSLTLTGENLTNEQLGEPDSITIVPGRTITLGLRARF